MGCHRFFKKRMQNQTIESIGHVVPFKRPWGALPLLSRATLCDDKRGSYQHEHLVWSPVL